MSESAVLTDAEVFADVLEAGTGDLDPDAARAVLRLGFSARQQSRMRELAERNNQGDLTDAEREEMESFRRVGNFLALVQSKARLALKRASAQSE